MITDDPLILMFGIIAAAVAGGAGGYVIGMTLGRTPPATPLPATIRMTREQLAATCEQLEKASSKLNANEKGELAGTALVLQRKISELSSQLGRIGLKAKRTEEGSS